MQRLAVLSYCGAIMAIGTLDVLTWALSGRTQGEATTLAFTTSVLFQLFNVFNARLERSSALSRHSFTDRWLWAALAGVPLLQIAVVHVPFLQSLFETTGLSAGDWALAAGVASSVLVLDELRKLALRAWGRRGARPQPRAR